MVEIQIHELATWGRNKIFILREDLLPIACGGNKSRIGQKLIEDAKCKGATAIIAYGNARSNLCRVLAMLCARNSMRCCIVAPVDDSVAETTNSRIVKDCGASIIECEKGPGIAAVIEDIENRLKQDGERPYYIFGNKFGRGNEAILLSAYQEVASSIVDWERKYSISFDRICLAAGTGSTCAGLSAGFYARGRKCKITGFTIAHAADECRRRIGCFPGVKTEDVEISGLALGGGYGKTNSELELFVRQQMVEVNILFDKTYAGKALWGLKQYIEKNELHDEMILFVHTGSLPLAIDGLRLETV